MLFICFGDSLTAGYPGYSPHNDGISKGYGNITSNYEYWLRHYCLEYTKENASSLYDKFENDLILVNRGIPGDTSSGLLHRISTDVLSHKPKPNYVIIIIGTNDLGWSSSTERILRNIKELHEIAQDFDITTIGGLIPPITKRMSNPKWDVIRGDFNDALEEYFIRRNIAYTDHKFMVEDGDYLKPEYTSGDGVHFSVAGYKMMGYSLFDRVLKKILNEKIKI
ncbi:MAG: SGNH/GDSL hydrolase family protein [Promethearchaeota archaeon]